MICYIKLLCIISIISITILYAIDHQYEAKIAVMILTICFSLYISTPRQRKATDAVLDAVLKINDTPLRDAYNESLQRTLTYRQSEGINNPALKSVLSSHLLQYLSPIDKLRLQKCSNFLKSTFDGKHWLMHDKITSRNSQLDVPSCCSDSHCFRTQLSFFRHLPTVRHKAAIVSPMFDHLHSNVTLAHYPCDNIKCPNTTKSDVSTHPSTRMESKRETKDEMQNVETNSDASGSTTGDECAKMFKHMYEGGCMLNMRKMVATVFHPPRRGTPLFDVGMGTVTVQVPVPGGIQSQLNWDLSFSIQVEENFDRHSYRAMIVGYFPEGKRDACSAEWDKVCACCHDCVKIVDSRIKVTYGTDRRFMASVRMSGDETSISYCVIMSILRYACDSPASTIAISKVVDPDSVREYWRPQLVAFVNWLTQPQYKLQLQVSLKLANVWPREYGTLTMKSLLSNDDFFYPKQLTFA